jgi:ADP-ribosylglycohydrolase
VHDVLDLRDIVADEWRQLQTAGRDVAALESPVREAVAAHDLPRLRALREELRIAPPLAGWPYVEPQRPHEIRAHLRAPRSGRAWRGSREALSHRIHGAWLARCVGCVMGKPVEGLDRGAIERYLRAAGHWPQTGYIPRLAPLPAGVEWLNPSAGVSLAGSFDACPRDDDLDYTVLGLHVLETYGTDFTADDVAAEWLDRLPFSQTYTAERATYRNLITGDRPAAAALRDNPYREWIGALIRADIFGYVCAGDPATAVCLATTDAGLSHVANGIYGAMWVAALVAAAFTATDLREALAVAATWIPPHSRLREAVDLVAALHGAGSRWDAAIAEIDRRVAQYPWVHTVNNAAGIAAALLWGDDDLARSVGAVVSLGWDTDSAAATVGSVLGAMHGTAVVPDVLAAPLNDTLRSAIRDYDRSAISVLARRTVALAADGHGPAGRRS